MSKDLVIEMVKKDGSIIPVSEIPGVRISTHGKGNHIIFHEESKFVNCGMSLQSGMQITIERSQYAINNLKIWGMESIISIGENFSCWGVEIRCHEPNCIVNIGNDCLFSEEILIYPTDVHAIFDRDTGRILNLTKPINIGNNVWCGRRVNILKGVNIPNNCIIGMASVVANSFGEEYCAIAGNPAKIIQTNVDYSRERPDLYAKRYDHNE